VLLILFIILGTILNSGLAILGLTIWLLALGGIVVGAFLIVQAGRPLAGAGAIVTAISLLFAFFMAPQPVGWMLWTALFFVGVVLVVFGTKQDTLQPNAWPAVLVRVGVGWGLVDSSQDHFWNFWLSGGGGSFVQQTTAAANRAPLWFLDPSYQAFLQGTALAN